MSSESTATPKGALETPVAHRVFISGDLSNFHLPEEALKVRSPIPPFWKGFLFPIVCGAFILLLTVMVGMSSEGWEGRMSETVFVSDGVQTEYSHVSQLPFDSEECYDVNLDLSNSESYLWIGRSNL